MTAHASLTLSDNLFRFPIVELSGTCESALRQLVAALVAAGALAEAHREDVVRQALRREGLGSTGIGHGFAFPHVKAAHVDRVLVVLGRSREGIDWCSIDRHPAHAVVFILSPVDRPGEHLRQLEYASWFFRHLPCEEFLGATGDSLALLAERLAPGDR